MPIAHITRRERFSPSHRLFHEDFTEQQNLASLGPCSHRSWHGHSYELLVAAKGEVNPTPGFVANLKAVSAIIQERVIAKRDHRNTNIDVDFMRGKLATTENLAVAAWNERPPILELGATLHCVKIRETENSFVEYFGNK